MKRWNQIQNPLLIDRIRRRLGMRQAHVTPTVGAELVPVIVVEDIRDQPQTRQNVFMANVFCAGTPTTHAPAGFLDNPTGSGITLKVFRIQAGEETDGTLALDLHWRVMVASAFALDTTSQAAVRGRPNRRTTFPLLGSEASVTTMAGGGKLIAGLITTQAGLLHLPGAATATTPPDGGAQFDMPWGEYVEPGERLCWTVNNDLADTRVGLWWIEAPVGEV